MEQLQIKRTINNQGCLFALTEKELTQAYRIKQREYIDDDFANSLADNAQYLNSQFHMGHLERVSRINILELCILPLASNLTDAKTYLACG